MGTQPKYSDGKGTFSPSTAVNKCNGYTYTVDDVSRASGAEQKSIKDALGKHIGSSTYMGEVSGNMTVTYADSNYAALTNDHNVNPSQVFLWNGVYIVAGAVSVPFKSMEVLKASFPFIQVVCPIITSLLSPEYSQGKKVTISAGGGAYALANTVANTRTGATVTWAASDMPSGMTINASTGAIAWATPVAGTYNIEVAALDVLSGEEDRTGFSTLHLTVTA